MAGEFPLAAGYQQLPNSFFIPEIFSMKILMKYYEEALVPLIVNFDYEGEIKQMGDKVHIRREPEAQINRYYIGQTLLRQIVLDQEVQLIINFGAYWNIPVDSIQKHQADIAWWSKVESNAARQHKRYVDQQLLGVVYGDADASNVMTNTTITPNNLANFVVTARVLLQQNFGPDQDRWMVVPYWMEGYFLLNPNFIRADVMGDSESMIRAGKIGKFANFNIYASPNLPVVTGYTQVTFGIRTAITFATQFSEQETLKNPDTFGDLMRGLQVFGWKTGQPTHLGKCGVVQGT